MSEIDDGLAFLLKDWDKAEAAALSSVLSLSLKDSSNSNNAFKAIDPVLGPDGGAFVFQWEDVFALGEMLDSVKDLSSDFSPPDLALLLKPLLKAWIKLRSVRVHLDEEEFRVLRAIKKNQSNIQQISIFTGLDEKQVVKTLSSLGARRYKVDTPLIEADGTNYKTAF